MVNRKRSWTLPQHLVAVLAVAAVWGHGTRAVEAQTDLTSEQIDLRDAIEERYDVALLTEGLGLARAEGDGIRMVELRARYHRDRWRAGDRPGASGASR